MRYFIIGGRLVNVVNSYNCPALIAHDVFDNIRLSYFTVHILCY